MSLEITVHELHAKRNAGEDFVLLDVREAEEVALVQLPNSVHIPMGDIPGRLHELDPDSEIVGPTAIMGCGVCTLSTSCVNTTLSRS